MAQANAEEKLKENSERSSTDQIKRTTSDVTGFKFNVQAPEFVPRSYSSLNQMPFSGYLYSCTEFLDGTSSAVASSDWLYHNNDNDPFLLYSNSVSSQPTSPNCSKNLLSDDLQLKIVKQVEYLFSDLSLLANDTMAKHVSKDSEGYVPIPVVASMKKIKALVTDHQLLVQALRSSTKLVVSKDGKKVKRSRPFTETYKDDLQCRTVVVENLPDDHSYPNLEKIFKVVGNVKAIRLCHPPEANASRAKNDTIISNKLHALVEYDSSDIAEKAAERLNDERNWRKGMRVRVMLHCTPKSVLKCRKSDFDALTDDDEYSPVDSPEETWQPNLAELVVDNKNGGENCSPTSRKAATRGRGKTKGRVQSHNGRGLLISPTAQSVGVFQGEALAKQTNKGPRMPDGTRGFTMGRGKPLSTPSTPKSPSGIGDSV